MISSVSIRLVSVLLSALVWRLQAKEFEFAGNPLVQHVSSADPSAHVWDNTLWVYTSKDGNLNEYGEGGGSWSYEYMDGYHVFSTTDMINWEDHGEIFHSRDESWGTTGWMWAPCAARKNGKYFLYYPHKDKEGEWRVGVAVASRPQGPFEDIGNPIPDAIGIDPMVFIDDDGEAYMYLNSAQVAKLNPDMISLAEPFRDIDYGPSSVRSDYNRNFEEGSYMHKYNGKYYYSYSNSRQNAPTAYYAIGDNPYGPFDWKGPLAGAKHSAPDHHSIVTFKGSWYYFYHMDTPWEQKQSLDWYGHRRIACYDKMYYDGEDIEFVSPTYFHVNSGGQADTSRDDVAFNWDMWYNGGSVSTYDTSISGTSDDFLYETERHGGWFEYRIPMSNGDYSIVFHFAENHFEEAGRRRFHVDVEGSRIINDLDVFALAGGKHRAYEEVHSVTLRDNEMKIEFRGVADSAMISAMSIQRTDLPDQPAVNPCNSNPCDNGDRCNNLGGGEHECESKFPCLDSPCRNSEVCVDFLNGFGDFECQNSLFACSENPCPQGGTCLIVTAGDGGQAICQYENAECFSAINEVEVRGKGLIRMDSLQIGDFVRDDDNDEDSFSRVYSFGHMDRNIKARYLQIYADGLEAPLEVSYTHMVFVSGRAVRASDVKVGDMLGTTTVTKIKTIGRRGVYAPVTYSGKIVVNGVVASSYVALLDQLPPTMQNFGSHVVMGVHRFMCRVHFGLCETETYSNGISDWINRPVRLVRQVNNENDFLPVVGVGILLLPLVAMAFCMDQIFVNPFGLLGMALVFLGTALCFGEVMRPKRKKLH